MAVTLTGTNSLFQRLGRLFFIAEKVEAHQGLVAGDSNSLFAEIQDAVAEYDAQDIHMISDFTGTDSTLAHQKNSANIYNEISQVAQTTVIEMVNDDTTLNQKTLRKALVELIDQMSTSAHVEDAVFSVAGDDAPTAITGTGDGKYFTSSSNGEGKKFQYLRVGSTTLECVKDAQISGTAGRETFTLKSNKAISDIRDPAFPGGYGNTNSIVVSDPSHQQQTGVGRNMLANGNFETFTVANPPDNWTVVTGTLGTTLLSEATVVHRGSKALEIVGNGSQLTKITQTFNTTGQTTAKFRPETRYGMCFWVRVDAVVSTGVLKVRIYKADGSTVLDTADIAIALSTELTDNTWTAQAVTFSTPLVLESSYKISVELTTAVTNTAHVYIDGLQVFRMQNLTNDASFHIAVIPGATDFKLEDEAKLAITQSTVSKFQKYLNKFLGLERMGIQMPYHASASIADSNIA